MKLSSDLIAQFVKVTNDKKEEKKETTLYGVAKKDSNGNISVLIDGAENPTPCTSMVNFNDGQRVMLTIKDHTAVITGNVDSPATIFDDIKDVPDALAKVTSMQNQMVAFDGVIANKVSADALAAESARIDKLEAGDLTVKNKVEANEASIKELQTKNLEVTGKVSAVEGEIAKLKTDKLDVTAADIEFARISGLLDATSIKVNTLEGTYATFASTTTGQLSALEADIVDLEAKKLSAEQAALTFANIDFTNITKAAMEYFYAASGLIDNVVVGDATISGRLVGVTISGDIIEGNTVVADKLVIKGEDGLYYKLNTDGVTTSAEQTDYNSLNGQVIRAKSITAEKVDVYDLVAFDATIGGFTITDDSIHSYVKDSEGNVTRGVYLGADGQINFGDESNFIKYYKDDSGAYRLAISAESIMYALNGKHYSIADLGLIGDYIHIGTYESEPCILLGESDSEFKLVITNTRIMFMEGTDIPAYINNKSLHIKKAVVEEELQQGNFVWTVRQNGNMGLIWKGGY